MTARHDAEFPATPMTSLHLALQQHYAGDDGQLEAVVDGYRVDVLRRGVVYEIQTGRWCWCTRSCTRG